jgi:carboxypeptidase C (cathepsin A)
MKRAILSLILLFAFNAVAQQQEQEQQPQGSADAQNPQTASPPKAKAKPKPGAKPEEQQKQGTAKPEEPKPAPLPLNLEPELKPSITHHSITLAGKTLRYTAQAGLMPIANEQGEIEAHIFYIAYMLEGVRAGERRPLTFTFNGGPGSSSVWLHMGAIGPKRVRMQPEGWMPAPPYSLEDNQATWLDQTDLVFIDPVGTGYSRAEKPELGKKFWGLKGDIESVGEFIRMFLTRNERWSSPLFLAGESYGTTRAAGLSGYLVDHGIALNGIVLVSTILDFQTVEYTRVNDNGFVLTLPTYTAIAWYHKKLPQDLQSQPLAQVLKQAQAFASGPYEKALERGSSISAEERAQAVEQTSRFTGLSKSYVDQANLRITVEYFDKELLRDQHKTVGRLDGRFTGLDEVGVSEAPDYDPSEAAIRPPFTALFNDYVRTELGWKTDREYYILGGGFRQWDFGDAGNGFPETRTALRHAFVKNPFMRVFVAEGYYDLATPYYAVDYTLDHLGLTPELRGQITTAQFEAGHMMYIRQQEIVRLRSDVRAFYEQALSAK